MPMDEADMDKDPIVQFGQWFELAVSAGIDLPNAMTLATATQDGIPSARYILLKDYNKSGFIFYSTASSPKGQQLAENPRAALIFFWAPMDRQIRIEGTVEQLSAKEADEYFRIRPRDSQISALASTQSSVVKSRAVLEERVQKIKEKYRDTDVPRPEAWIGYRVRPVSIEFWQGRENRLHDRLLYRLKEGGGWGVSRLAP